MSEQFKKAIKIVFGCGLGLMVGSCVFVCAVQEPDPKLAIEGEIVYSCHKAVESNAKFGSEADFDWGYEFNSNSTGAVVAGRVKLLNGFGAMIPHQYFCKFELVGNKVGKLTSFNVNPG